MDWLMVEPIRHGQAWVRRGSEDTAVFNPDTGLLHLLNPSAFAIWEACDGETRGQEIAEAVAELTGIDVEMAREEIAAALSVLGDLGLLVRPPGIRSGDRVGSEGGEMLHRSE